MYCSFTSKSKVQGFERPVIGDTTSSVEPLLGGIEMPLIIAGRPLAYNKNDSLLAASSKIIIKICR